MRRISMALALVLAACADPDPLERMTEQPRYDPYERGPEFADGRVLQHPPAGTVPRDRPAGDPSLTPGTAEHAEAAGEDGIPIPVTPEVLADGGRLYAIHCAACHGAGGFGGSAVAMNMQPPLPTSLVTGHGARHTPAEYFTVITEGAERMPSYAAELRVRERWMVVAYLVGVLQRPHPLGAAERRDSARAAVLRRRWPGDASHSDDGHAHGGGGAAADTSGTSAGEEGGHGHDHEH